MEVTEEELKALAKNEERLWDMAAITAAPTLFGVLKSLDEIAKFSYDLADALIAERKRRFLQGPDTSGVGK